MLVLWWSAGCTEEPEDACIELVNAGQEDEVTEYRYDPDRLTWAGGWQTIGFVTRAGGERRVAMEWAYNDEGDIVHARHENRLNADPFEIVTDYDYEYGSSGEILRAWTDDDADGSWSGVREYTYDAWGRRTAGLDTYLPSGEVFERWTVTYEDDADGTRAFAASDYGDDGGIDSTFEWTEDASGAVLFEAWGDGDGVEEMTRTYTRRADGGITWAVETRYGEPYEAWSVAYTAEGSLQAINVVSLVTLEVARTYAYAYDERGLLARKDRDWDGDGAIDESEGHVYLGSCWADAQGNPEPPAYR